jgi:GT2 family glycosyltransferase
VWLAGYRIVTAPKAVVYHWTAKPSGLREKTISRQLSEFHSNKAPRILIKNYEFRNVVKYLPQALMIHLFRSLVNLIKGDLVPFMAFFKASIWNLKLMRDTSKERRRIQCLRKISDKYLMQRVMIKGSFVGIYKKYLLPSLMKARIFHKVQAR